MDPAPMTTTSSGVAGMVAVVLPVGRRPTGCSLRAPTGSNAFSSCPEQPPPWETVLFGGATGPPTVNKRSPRLLPSWTPWSIPRQPVAAPNWGVSCGARRAQISPVDVGLPVFQGIRRTPGLRREELATLAGISNDYYTRLERGKETRPSPEVIDALARALQLEDDERDHLRSLAALAARRASTPPPPPSRTVPAGILILLDRLRPYPAHVVGRNGDLLA